MQSISILFAKLIYGCFSANLSALFQKLLLLIVCGTCCICTQRERITGPVEPMVQGVSYDGRTDQDQLIWFVVDQNVITFLHFEWKTNSQSQRALRTFSDTLAVIRDNKFVLANLGEISITGTKPFNKFIGVWNSIVSETKGYWTAGKTTRLITQNDSITINAGTSAFNTIKCGIIPYQIVSEPDSNIVRLVDYGTYQIHGSMLLMAQAKGTTEMIIGDSSRPQLTVKIFIQVN